MNLCSDDSSMSDFDPFHVRYKLFDSSDCSVKADGNRSDSLSDFADCSGKADGTQ